MKHLLVPLGLAIAAPLAAQPQESVLGDAGKLSVLYAGHPESPRAAAYVGFLREWFARVD